MKIPLETAYAQATPGPLAVAHSPKLGVPFVTNQTGKLTVANSIGGETAQRCEANAALLAHAFNVLPEVVNAARELLDHACDEKGACSVAHAISIGGAWPCAFRRKLESALAEASTVEAPE